ncbi:MAG: hypothetical protein HYT80_11555 [Euryarchaeota archaeon]|nr:hypothetical protein [Euryarchaeota archaeon]
MKSDFRYWLQKYRGVKKLPVVAFVEFAALLQPKRSMAQIMGFIRAAGLYIEDLGLDLGHRAVASIGFAQEGEVFDWVKDWRDHVIASHAHTAPVILVTDNVEDFGFLGNRVYSVQDCYDRLG